MARLRTSATGPTAVPQSRQHGKRGSSLRQSLSDGTHSGATVPSARETGLFPPSVPPRQDPQRCHGPVTAGNRAFSCTCPSATGSAAVPQSRQHGKRGSSLRQSLRDRIHSGATVPSARETGLFPPSVPPRQDPQRCHGPVTAGKQHSGAGLPIGWRRSRGILAQVRKNGGVLRRETASSASQWRRTPREKQTCSTGRGDLRRKEDRRYREKGPAPPGEGTCATGRRTCATGRGDLRRKKGRPAPPAEGTCVAKLLPVLSNGAGLQEKNRPAPLGRGTCATGRGDLRRKEDRRHQKGDLRHRERGLTPEGGSAPPEGRPAPPAEGTCATGRGDRRHQKEDLRHRERGLAPKERGTGATGRKDRRHQKEDLRHREKGPAPPGEGTCAGRRDRRHREKGPAPKERGTGATGRGDLRHPQKGPAPQGADLMRTKEES